MEVLAADLLGSATAGMIGRLVCHPIDTLKSKLQSGKPEYRTFASTFHHTWKYQGVMGFYRGLGAVMIGGIPGVSLYLTSYERSKCALTEHSSLPPVAIYLASGMIAEAISCVIFVPVDVIKERIQVQSQAQTLPSSHVNLQTYRLSYDAAQSIISREGVRGMYRGYVATLLSYGPFSSLYFGLYETLKTRLQQHRLRTEESTNTNTIHQDLQFYESLTCSAIAGAASSYITSPLDMAKLRMQISDLSSTSPGLFATLLQIYQRDGFVGLFKGASTRVLFHTPATAITMATFEQCRSLWAAILK